MVTEREIKPASQFVFRKKVFFPRKVSTVEFFNVRESERERGTWWFSLWFFFLLKISLLLLCLCTTWGFIFKFAFEFIGIWLLIRKGLHLTSFQTRRIFTKHMLKPLNLFLWWYFHSWCFCFSFSFTSCEWVCVCVYMSVWNPVRGKRLVCSHNKYHFTLENIFRLKYVSYILKWKILMPFWWFYNIIVRKQAFLVQLVCFGCNICIPSWIVISPCVKHELWANISVLLQDLASVGVYF